MGIPQANWTPVGRWEGLEAQGVWKSRAHQRQSRRADCENCPQLAASLLLQLWQLPEETLSFPLLPGAFLFCSQTTAPAEGSLLGTFGPRTKLSLRHLASRITMICLSACILAGLRSFSGGKPCSSCSPVSTLLQRKNRGSESFWIPSSC